MESNNDDKYEDAYLQLQQSEEIRKNIHEISTLLNTGLKPDALDICVQLIEAGVHPQALAEVVNQINKEVASIKE